MKVQVDKAAWVEPDAVDAVTPGSSAHVVRLHLRSGAVIAITVGPEHPCTDIAAVVALLQPDAISRYQPPLDGWRPLGVGDVPPTQPFPPGTILSTTDDPMRRDMQDDIGDALARIARDTTAMAYGTDLRGEGGSSMSVQDVSVLISEVLHGKNEGLSATRLRSSDELKGVPRETVSAAIAYGVDKGALTLDDDYRVHEAVIQKMA